MAREQKIYPHISGKKEDESMRAEGSSDRIGERVINRKFFHIIIF